MEITSVTTGRTYESSRTVRIVNVKQVCFYVDRYIYPVDFFSSLDRKTGEPILVFLFYKDETYEAYTEWKNRLHKEIEERY